MPSVTTSIASAFPTKEPMHNSKQSVFNDKNVVNRVETQNVCYEFTTTMFRKTSRLTWHMDSVSGPIMAKRLFNHERITNEVNALKLVSQHTTIPIPRLIDHGINSDGTRYLVTELISGITLDSLHGMGCQVTIGQKHTDDISCKTCIHKAYSNATEFIQNTVFPQLSTMKSNTRGIDGFVMPPVWLPIDTQEPWKGSEGSWKTLPLETSEYVFQHGDLAAHNVLIDEQTLQVKALIDWEYAGYYPAGIELWPGTLEYRAYLRRARGDNMAELIRKYIPEDYLEACSQWEDKEELELLVRCGYLPDPEILRASISAVISHDVKDDVDISQN